MLHVFLPSKLCETAIEAYTNDLFSLTARESYLRPELQTINETELSKIVCNPFPHEVHSLQSSSATPIPQMEFEGTCFLENL